ncbi:hypothetical protein EXIGLDRAFT_840729 [Exidia glandulosa HHB12029]|uniref:DUF6699 domain-containing protein n=1 Tax=Exidia glandulosa HHB12029 TaxID=1314781 RepID=A0A165EAU0_EXIGL|nr:hypothetical protein EXIGLDRAFT_840729 [Exidia glandulosa HHB12029]
MAAPFRDRKEPYARPRFQFYTDRDKRDSPPPPYSSDAQQAYVPHRYPDYAYPPRLIRSPPPAHNLPAQDALQPLDPARLAAAAAILSVAAARLAGAHAASPAFEALDAAVVILAGASSASGSRSPSSRETPAPSPTPRPASFIPVPPTPFATRRRPSPIHVDSPQLSGPVVAPRSSPPPPPVTSSPPIQHHEVPSSPHTSQPQPQPQRRRSRSNANSHVRWADGRTGDTPTPSTMSFPHESDPSNVLYASGYRPSSSPHPAPGPRVAPYGPEAGPGYVGGVCWLLNAGEIVFDVTRDHVYWRRHLSSHARQAVPISQLESLPALSEPAREVEVVMVLPWHSSAHTYGRIRVAASDRVNVSVTDVFRALHDELMTPLSTQELVEMDPGLQRRLERNRDERQGPSAPLRRVHYLDGAHWLGRTILNVDGAGRWRMRARVEVVPVLVVELYTWEIAERLARDVYAKR